MSFYITQNEQILTNSLNVNLPFTIDPQDSYAVSYDNNSFLLNSGDTYTLNEYTQRILKNQISFYSVTSKRMSNAPTDPFTLNPNFSNSFTGNNTIYYTTDANYVQLMNDDDEPVGEPMDATGIYEIKNVPRGTYYLSIVSNQLIYDQTVSIYYDPMIVSDICFVKGTIIHTDQGFISIDKITNQTLNHMPITVTKTIHYDPYLVKVSANAFGKFPTRDTYMSLKHHILLENPTMARELVNNDTILLVPYNGEPLYNVLVDTHSVMKVHGMIVETLDPTSIVGLFYKAKLSPKQKSKMIRMINEDPINARKYFI